MAKNLLIVESPAKAKTIGAYLGSDFQVLASYGHVRDLPKSKLGIETDKDFAADYEIIPKAKKVLSEIKSALEKSDELYLATDPDREGEAIAWHLTQALKSKKPTHRVAFTEITKSAVQEAIKKPREILANLVDAQQARRILDRLVGYKLSPLLWKKVYRGLSAGRVQSVAVRLVVEREREIEAFKSREFWTLDAELIGHHGSFKAWVVKEGTSVPLELDKQAEVESWKKKLDKAKYEVESIEKYLGEMKPQPPLITSTLQQLAARLCSFSAKRTMKLAQDLYEGMETGEGSHGLITYMRTDSYNMADIAKKEAESVVGKTYGAKYLPATPNLFTKKVRGAQEAHEAIRPTSFARTPESLKAKLDRDHYRLYELIYRAALASTMAPAKIETTNVKVATDQKIGLQARGRELKFDGFLKIYPDSDERFEKLPELTQSEKLKLKSLTPTQHLTEPPARYSEATLVRELEKRGIGRPSTYAPIMSTIVDRGYVTKQAGRFTPQDVAGIVTDLLIENFPDIVDYDFTAKMEEDLDEIAEGDKKLVPVIREFYEPFAKNLKEKEKSIDKKELVQEKTDKKCPDCGAEVLIKLSRFGKFYACSAYPKCKYSAPYLDDDFSKKEEKQIAEEAKEKCPDCGGDLNVKQSRFGTFLGCSNYPKCKFTKSIVVSSGIKCPNCGHDIVKKTTRKGRIFYGCSGYPKCKTAFWDEPTDKKCPKCSNLLVKKKSGLACSQCDYAEEVSEASAEADKK
ncbi:MAG TPA: type I DNA topoisomerase [Candidatus Saccharimonadales bacterium]|nr:type I DNA topoisomerase [Candidatus Saccharimonadales bacterium]